MTHTEILNLLKNNKVDTYDAMIATSCDAAYENLSKKVQKKLDYDSFCYICDDIWRDCDEPFSVSTIADAVADLFEDCRSDGEIIYMIDNISIEDVVDYLPC